MNERKYLEQQIGSCENQKTEALSLIHRCDGALQVLRARLAFIVQEAEAQAKSDAEALMQERGTLQAVLAAPSGNGEVHEQA